MKLRLAPPAATWLLKSFCQGAEYDAVIGDLIEQYQRGHSPAWYWKQVLAIVFFGTYRRAVQRPLVSGSTWFGMGFGLIVAAAGIAVALMSGIGALVLLAIIGGLFAAGLIGLFRDRLLGPTPSAPPRIIRIDSSKIPIFGGVGAGIAIAALLGGLLHDVPEVRILAMPGILIGLLFAVALRLWRKTHEPPPRIVSLGLADESHSRRKMV
jgi:hypothetical protein